MMFNRIIKRVNAIMLSVMIFLMITLYVAPVGANSKIQELERKSADLSLLDQQLEDRMQQAQNLRSELREQQNMLSAEIQVLIRNFKVNTLQQAQQHLRIRYNMTLLGMVLSYIRELDEKMAFYQAGRDRLGYLRQLAEDDKRMISALNDLKIDALTTQISLVINSYLPEAHIIQIDPKNIKPLSAQQVWERINKG